MQFLIAMSLWWNQAEDVNDTDMDLVEYNNTDPDLGELGPMVLMFYCWGSQHSNNGLGFATAPGRRATSCQRGSLRHTSPP